MTLLEFLRARVAEDEQTARAAADHGDRWSFDSGGEGIYPSDESRHPGPIVIGCYDYFPDQYGEHIARHDPARVLAEVEAKRRIMELAEEATGLDMQVDSEFRVGSRDSAAEPYVGDLILRSLALSYGGHEDYRAEWGPDGG